MAGFGRTKLQYHGMAISWRSIFSKAMISYKQGFMACLASTARIISVSPALANVHSIAQKCNSSHESSALTTPQTKRGASVSRLKSRGVIRFDGPDTIKYLQGIVTNDLKRFEEPSVDVNAALSTSDQPIFFSGPIYAALLSPNGRILYDLFFYRFVHPEEKLNMSASGPGDDAKESPSLFADVDADQLDELVGHLKMYRLRAKVEIQDVSKDLAAWQRFGGALAHESSIDKAFEAEGISCSGSHDLAGLDIAQASEQGWRWSKDPRLPSLGLRGLFPSDTVPLLIEADKEVDEQCYLLRRLEEGVPEGSAEIPKGEAIPLEYNLAGLNAISFEKGCYVGQESVARIHHRGVIRKRLLPVNFVQENGEEVREAVGPMSKVVDVHSGKMVGNITTVLGSRGFALLKLEAALKSSSQLNVKGLENVQVKVVRPKWWPSEWFQEEEP